MYQRNVRTFEQILGEHGVMLCELALASKKNRHLGIFYRGVDIYKLSKEWSDRITEGEKDEKSEFCKMTQKLIVAYSCCLADYILDKRGTPEWKERITCIVNNEAEFFNTLSNKDAHKQWLMYTSSVINMVDVITNYGDDDDFGDVLENVVRNALLLGQWFDSSLK